MPPTPHNRHQDDDSQESQAWIGKRDFANFGKKQHPKVDKLRIKTTNSKIPTNHSKMMAKCSKKRRRKGCSRCGGSVEHGLFMSIYLHSRSFGGQMYVGKYNTDIENLAAGIYCIYVYYAFEHLYTARYGIIIGPL